MAPGTLAPMSTPPPDKPASSTPVIVIKSPRDAATWAIVYRRRIRDRPRDRLLKLAGVIGTLLVHVVFLLGAILGSPYELPPPPPEPKGNPLLVRLIENKPQPPPPPPIRGVPPKEHGPTHRGNTSQVVRATHETSTAAPVAAVTQPPAPAPKQEPVVAKTEPPAAEKAQQPAAPLPPITLPKPSPPPIQQPTPAGLPPPPLTLQAVQVPQPIPPQFQPEPIRKAQAEGTQPMPPLPSIALPTQPAQSALTTTPPQMAVEQPALAPVQMPSVAAVQPNLAAASPPAPSLQPIPLPAQVAPTVNLQSSAAPLATPNVPRTSQQIVGPVARLQEQPALAPVPITPAAAPTPNAAPAAPLLSIEAPKLAVPEVSLRPQLSPAPSVTPATPQTEAKPSASPSSEKATAATSSPAPSTAPSSAQANEGNASTSSAPNATPQGSETANPGQPNGVIQSPSENSAQGTQPSPSIGNGNNTAGEQGGGTPGSPNGTYIQLKPRGDTEIMSHNTNLPRYRSTVFDKYWTPEGESSVDTALRHAVEKTTMKHTFNLPKGVRIECAVMPLMPVALFGCHNPDPPAVPLPQNMYDRLNLPTQNASIPKAVAPAASAPSPAAPVVLDNSAECAAARVSGGPMPPSCGPAALTPVKPLTAPAPASTSRSWVPASDQFH